MELTFSPAVSEDIEAIFTLSKHLIDDYEDITAIDYEKVLRWVRRKIETNISDYVCIFYGGRKAGYYRFTPCDGMMELDDLYILPDYRSRGIGTAVIRKCCGSTHLPVMLYVFTQNEGAMALYRRMGFSVTEAVSASRCIMVRPGEANA